MSLSIKRSQTGFTIIELIIATSVFSAIMLLATTGIVTMGKRYHKGLTVAKTQEQARSLEAQISDSIQLSGDAVIKVDPDPSDATDFANRNDLVGHSADFYNPKAICVDNVRYSYVLNTSLGKDSSQDISKLHVLWKDIIIAGQPCKAIDAANFKKSTPQDGYTDLTASAQHKEMLANNMRLNQFSIKKNINGLYNISIRVMYGADDVIDHHDLNVLTDDTCLPNSDGGYFCADSTLSTFVKRRL